MTAAHVGIVGAGQVGMAAAAALFHGRHVGAITLVDRDRERAVGEAMDLMHGQALVGPCTVNGGDFGDLAGTRVVVVTAGVGQARGESRLELLGRNVGIMSEIMTELDRVAPEAVILIATNPVDVLTRVCQDISTRPQTRVIGTGTSLDSARLRALLGRHYEVSPQSVHAYVLGEHGDSEFVAWSLASIESEPLVDNDVLGVSWDQARMEGIEGEVRRAAADIIARKGHTNWAIGAVINHLVGAIVRAESIVVPVSVDPGGSYGIVDVCLSLPVRLGRDGVGHVLTPRLTTTELESLLKSAEALRRAAP
ncbi:L-lactate dehydrogenase [soil metagenome]